MHGRLLLTLIPFVLAASVTHAEEKSWQRVMSGERKVGFVEHTRRVEGARAFETETLTLELGATGRRVTYRVRLDTESDLQGALLHLVRESRTSEGHSRLDARMVGPDLLVEIGAGKAMQRRTLTGVGPLRSEEFAREWLQSVGAGQSPVELRYRSFDPARVAVAEIELIRLPGDGEARMQRTVRVGDVTTIAMALLDAQGRVADLQLRLGGLELRLVGSTEAEALTRNEVLDHVVGQMQKSPYRIPSREMHAKIRYGFDNGGSAPSIPVGAGQRSWTDGQTTWLQVCASCPLDAMALGESERAAALAATPWLNYNEAALSGRVRRVTGGFTDPAKKMARLTAFVRGHMNVQRIDMLGYGSALEAFKSHRGDCTEYAVLLAAMGRAAGVPTRVVSGMVYARHFEGQRHVFVPHAWMQAWTGTGWQAFDAAIGEFDSTHLAFATSYDGNPAQLFAGLNLAHRLRLTAAARVVPRKELAN